MHQSNKRVILGRDLRPMLLFQVKMLSWLKIKGCQAILRYAEILLKGLIKGQSLNPLKFFCHSVSWTNHWIRLTIMVDFNKIITTTDWTLVQRVSSVLVKLCLQERSLSIKWLRRSKVEKIWFNRVITNKDQPQQLCKADTIETSKYRGRTTCGKRKTTQE